jgi:hypothetical protein
LSSCKRYFCAAEEFFKICHFCHYILSCRRISEDFFLGAGRRYMCVQQMCLEKIIYGTVSCCILGTTAGARKSIAKDWVPCGTFFSTPCTTKRPNINRSPVVLFPVPRIKHKVQQKFEFLVVFFSVPLNTL